MGETRPRRLDPEREEELWRLVQAAFRERRKMLHNVLPRQLPFVGRDRFVAAMEAAGIAHDRRPQTVERGGVARPCPAPGAAAAVSAMPEEAEIPVVRREARAKLNLGLAVTGRRADGYHELRSVFLRDRPQ